MLRRSFIQTSTLAVSSLIVGFSVLEQKAVAATAGFENPWIRISSDNSVTMVAMRAEMGQDVYTTFPLIMAEELDYPVSLVKVEMAPFNPAHYGNLSPYFGGMQVTGGSQSVMSHWTQLRTIGAAARTMLVKAAAGKWGVSPAACTTQDGYVMSGALKASYGELASLAALQQVPQSPTLKNTKDFKYIGKEVARLDTKAKVDGTAEFGIDVRQPGMLAATVARCPVMGGKVRGFDAEAARKVPGVQGVYQIEEGIAVVAIDYYVANLARGLLKIDWDLGDTSSRKDTDTIMQRLRDASKKPGAVAKKAGNSAEPMAGAATVLSANYESPFLAHATLEPVNCSASIANGECHVWGPFQTQQFVHAVAAAIAGVPPEKVFVHTSFIGGGLGRKSMFDFVKEAVTIAKVSGKPVRLIWSREGDTQNDFYRPASVHTLEGGLDTQGRLIGLTAKITSPSPSIDKVPAWVSNGVDLYMVEGLADVGYELPNFRAEAVIQDVGVRVGFWRSVSYALNAFAMESFIDELASAAKRDPLEFRIALLQKQPRAVAVLKLVAEKAGWGKPLPPGRFLGIAQTHCYGSYVAVVAEVSVKDGQPLVHQLSCAVDAGIAVRPNQIEAQIEGGLLDGFSSAMFQKISFKNGQVEQENFDTYKMLRFEDVPLVHVHIVKTDNPPSGIGEAGVPLAAPAIANAFALATGRRLRKLPFLDA